jgi:multiple sugar transport system permease protein
MTNDSRPRILTGGQSVARTSLAVIGRQASIHLMMLFFGIVFLIPFFWLLSTSVKSDAQMFAWPPIWIPNPVVLENYPKGLAFLPFGQFTANSFVIAGGDVVGTLFSCSLGAYGLSRIRWPGRDLLFVIVLATIMVPFQVRMIPLFIVFRSLGWIDTLLPLIVPSFFGRAFYIFLLRQFFLTIPRDLSEAAKVDGASELNIFWRVIMPLATPALATVTLFTFLGAWGDFLGPLIYLNSESNYTVSLGLSMFHSQYGSHWGEMMAVTTVMTLPIVVLFFFTQRTFIQGITLTGIKG